MIPDEAIEAAAMAILAVDPATWAQQTTGTKDRYRWDAQAALQAAAPYLMAQAWDEGVDWVWEGGPDVKDDNPYRSAGAGE